MITVDHYLEQQLIVKLDTLPSCVHGAIIIVRKTISLGSIHNPFEVVFLNYTRD